MQSSITADPLHSSDLRTYSDDSIHVNREIRVISTPDSETDKSSEATLRPFSPAPNSMCDGIARTQSSYVSRTNSGRIPVINKWKSNPDMLDASHGLGIKPFTLENTRESMSALSEFLRTKEPPQSNWMSFPSEEDLTLRKTGLKKFLGRSRSKRQSRLLKLPDSAVAATTSSGSRHIAISIPLEGWPADPPPIRSPSKRSQTQAKLPLERAAVTVLKPVVEVESNPNTPYATEFSGQEKRLSHAESICTPASEILGPEATRTIENYYMHLNRQQRHDASMSSRLERSRSSKSYTAIHPAESVSRQGSQRADSRQSGGTIHSMVSTNQNSNHSGGASNESAPPKALTSLPHQKLECPPRHSSISKMSPAIQSDLAQLSKLADVESRTLNEARISAILSVKSAGNVTIQTSPTIGTVETFQSLAMGSAGLQVNRSTTPKPPSPAPTKSLPQLPPNSAPISRRHSAECSSYLNLAPAKQGKITSSKPTLVVVPSDGAIETTRPCRQDKVKAKKQRDMALLREKTTQTGSPVENGTENPSRGLQNISHSHAPSPRPKKRLGSPSIVLKKAPITFSPIMVVASQSPSPTWSASPTIDAELLLPHASQVTLRKLSRSPGRTNRNLDTPPHSITSSSNIGSDSDTIPIDTIKRKSTSTNQSSISLPSPRPSVKSPSSIKSSASLDLRRLERRSKRNMGIKEKEYRELEARMRKIEKDNKLMMNTIGGIANSFQEWHRLYSATGRRRSSSVIIEEQGGALNGVVRKGIKETQAGDSEDEIALDF